MTTIGLFSSIHGDEMQRKFGWDDTKSIALFDTFRPDVVCGEVRRSDYENGADYQGPSEYQRYIFNYCKDRGIPFLPCDYFRDEDIELARRPLTVPDGEEAAEQELSTIMQDFWEAGGSSTPPSIPRSSTPWQKGSRSFNTNTLQRFMKSSGTSEIERL